MISRIRNARRVATSVGVVGAALALTAGTAVAGGNLYTVAVGGSSSSGTHGYTAADNDGITFEVENQGTSNVVTMTCDSVDVAGTIQSGSGIEDIATIDSSTWNNCQFGSIALEVSQVGTWVLNGDGPATSAATDVVDGHVHNVEAHVESTIPGLCSFNVRNDNDPEMGRADGQFDEATQVLRVNESGFSGDLTVYDVSGCLGAVSNGDPANFLDGNFTINSPDGPINLQ